MVGGLSRSFLIAPMWIDIYNDRHHSKQILAGRQVFKSTYCTDALACEATTRKGIQVNYTTYADSSLSTFSTQRMRVGTFLMNPILSKFPRHGVGSIGEISLWNNSTIYMTTHHHQYKNIEGKSIDLNMLDEAQYQDLEFANRVQETMTATNGRLEILGIGGEAGSAYHNLWLKTDQREWVYTDPNWRDRLEFDSGGLVIGKYLLQVLKGKWVPREPDNAMYHGYWIPQHIMPTIPVTVDDAVNLYRTSPKASLEYKKGDYTSATYTTHVRGQFHRAERRPVTPAMVRACMTPYRYLRLCTLQEIADIKDVYGDSVKIAMGIDWGSGPTASSTVMSIVIHWKKSGKYHLAYIDKRPAEHQLDQTRLFVENFKEAHCDYGIADLGYGAIQVKAMQIGGADSHGNMFEGLGEKIKGCRSTGAEHEMVHKQEQKIDEHGETTARFTLDKTAAVQGFIDMLDTFVPHPLWQSDQGMKRPKLIIPFHYGEEYRTDWLINDFCDITRKDLVQIEEEGQSTDDTRRFARKEFNHPKDSTMSIIYAKTALETDSDWHWVSG